MLLLKNIGFNEPNSYYVVIKAVKLLLEFKLNLAGLDYAALSDVILTILSFESSPVFKHELS